jgi:hypothetical protein
VKQSGSLHSDVQSPHHVGDEFLHVLVAAVGEGDASALSVGRRRCGGDDPFRIDDDGLIVRLRELHECHERPCLYGNVGPASNSAVRVRDITAGLKSFRSFAQNLAYLLG